MVSTEDPRPSEAPHVQLVVEERFEDADEALSDAADVPGLVKQQTYTVDDALEELPLSNRVRLLMYVTCGIAWTMDGMEILLLAFIGPALRCDWHITDAQAASLTMVVFIGMMIGAVLWGAIADVHGRKASLLLSSSIVFVAGVACAFAPSFRVLLFLRLVVGIGVIGYPVALSLLCEVMPKGARGQLIMSLCLWWTLGSVSQALAASLVMPTLGWRWLVGLTATPALLLIGLVPFIPESPRFYLATDQPSKAVSVLARILDASGQGLPEGILVPPETALVRESSTPHSAGDVRAIFGTPTLRRSTVACWGVMFSAGFGYYGAVLLTTELLASDPCGYHGAGGGGEAVGAELHSTCRALTADDYVHNLIATAGELPGVLACLGLIDVVGRKPMIASLAALMALALGMLVPCTTANVQAAALFMMRAFVTGLFQSIFVFVAEVYSTQLRALGVGWATAWSRIGGLTTPFVAQLLSQLSMKGALATYALVSLSGAAFVLSAPYETRGITLM